MSNWRILITMTMVPFATDTYICDKSLVNPQLLVERMEHSRQE